MSSTPPPPGQPLSPPPRPPLPSVPPGPRRNPVVVAVAVVVVVVVVLGGGIAGIVALQNNSSPASAPSPATTAPTGPATTDPSPTATLPATNPKLARYYHQKLRWQSCGRDDCSLLTVPLDYAKPDGTSIQLAVLRVPAQDRSRRIGALVVNPGGPGGSGVDFAAAGSLQFGTPLSDRFDIVGFDPRGVGRSEPLKCLSTRELDSFLAMDPDPDTLAERNTMDQQIRAFGQGCLTRSGDLARHMSTDEVARDMDILRAALGQQKLDYLGSSYGTFIGAVYANLFPSHVGRFVLDGAIDPALSNAQLALEQAGGFEVALRAYVKDCVDAGGCFLGSGVDAGMLRIRAFLLQADHQPLPTDDPARPLTEGLAMIGIFTPLYVKDEWPQLTDALRQAMEQHRGTALLSLADLYADRGPSGYTDNLMEALNAVNCLDHDDSIPTKDVPAHFAQFERVSPTFGRAFAFSLSFCSDWPVRSGATSAVLHAAGAPPIVVIGTTRDPATPLRWAQALARELDSGRLITRDGDGHTGFRRGNSCVDNAVQNFLIDGKAPAKNLFCAA